MEKGRVLDPRKGEDWTSLDGKKVLRERDQMY